MFIEQDQNKQSDSWDEALFPDKNSGADPARSAGPTGTIPKKTARDSGAGEANAGSEEDSGSRDHVQENVPASDTKESEGKLVLLVDDDPLIVRMYQKKLSQEGYKVHTAANGEEAIAFLQSNIPNLILLDVMMPKMHGVETLKAIKGNEKTKDIPVIILTNLGDNKDDIENAKRLGALDYLVKSEIDLKALSRKVKSVIDPGR